MLTQRTGSVTHRSLSKTHRIRRRQPPVCECKMLIALYFTRRYTFSVESGLRFCLTGFTTACLTETLCFDRRLRRDGTLQEWPLRRRRSGAGWYGHTDVSRRKHWIIGPRSDKWVEKRKIHLYALAKSSGTEAKSCYERLNGDDQIRYTRYGLERETLLGLVRILGTGIRLSSSL